MKINLNLKAIISIFSTPTLSPTREIFKSTEFWGLVQLNGLFALLFFKLITKMGIEVGVSAPILAVLSMFWFLVMFILYDLMLKIHKEFKINEQRDKKVNLQNPKDNNNKQGEGSRSQSNPNLKSSASFRDFFFSTHK